MSKTFISLIICALAITASAVENQYIARVYFDNHNQVDLVNSRLALFNEQEALLGDYIVTSDDFAFLDRLGLKYDRYDYEISQESIITGLNSFLYSQQQMIDSLFSWAAQYPEIAQVESIGVSQQEQRIIYAMKISDLVAQNENEPTVLFDGAHHACEIMGMEICMALIDSLLSGYGRVDSITRWINNTQIYVVPLVNPDGNSAVHSDISYFYRKNGRDLDNDGILYEYSCNTSNTCGTEGIDLNRNYNWYWSEAGSETPRQYDYRGQSANSESETQAMTSLVARIRPALSISYHSRGELVYYPMDLLGGIPDYEISYSIASSLSSRIRKEGTGHYNAYLLDGEQGGAINWQYGRFGVFAFLIETMASNGSFIPETQARKDSIVNSNLVGAYYLIGRASGSQVYGQVTDAATGRPLEAEIRIRGMYSNLLDPRMSEPQTGRYRRILNPGTYTIDIIHPDYAPGTFQVNVQDGAPAGYNVQLTSLLGIDSDNNLPKEYVLLNPYPNPFNNQCVLQFGIPKTTKVKVEVFDILGRKVGDLADGEFNAGDHSLAWSGSKTSSGVYLFRFETNEKTMVVKGSLLK